MADWNSWAEGAESRQAQLYSRFPSLFTVSNIQLVRRSAQEAHGPRDRKALVFLKRYLEGEYLARQTASIQDSITNLMESATVPLDSTRVGYFRVSSILANELKHPRRLAAYRAQDSVLDMVNPLYIQKLQIERREAARLGYRSMYDFYEEQKGIRFTDLEKLVREFLAATEGMYDTGLTIMSHSQLNMDRSDLRRADIPAMNRLLRFDEYFAKDSLVADMKKAWRGVGVEVDSQPNVHIDTALRERKNPRAACFPVRIPDDIRVSVKPIGGMQDFEALYHEMGHAEHYAFTRQGKMEFRRLGTNAYTECMAFLNEYLLEDPSYVGTQLLMEGPDFRPYIGQAAFLRLLLIRRYAGKFLYEMDLHRGNVQPEVAYLHDMQAALAYDMDEHDARRCYDDDEGFYEADYLQAWFLEAMVRQVLRQKFGPRYFLDPAAGKFLKTLWAPGQELTPDELAVRLGYAKLEWTPLNRQLRYLINDLNMHLPDNDEDN